MYLIQDFMEYNTISWLRNCYIQVSKKREFEEVVIQIRMSLHMHGHRNTCSYLP